MANIIIHYRFISIAKGGLPLKNTYRRFDDLPLTLTAKDLMDVLEISRVNTYNLMNSSDFPTFRIGKKMFVTKDNLIRWLDEKSS